MTTQETIVPAKKDPKESLPQPAAKPKVIIVMAQDGRVGKSILCKMIIHALQHSKKQPIIVDTDPMNPNVARSYTPEVMEFWGNTGLDSVEQKEGVDRFRRQQNKSPNISDDSTDEGKIARILSQQIVFDSQHPLGSNILALTEFGRDVIVNTSGNVYRQLFRFLVAQEADKDKDFNLCICWVTNGTKDSLDLFLKTQKRFSGAEHVLIFNEGNTQYIKDWDNYYLTPEIAKLDEASKIKLVSLPLLSVSSDFWDDRQNQPYREWLADESLGKRLRRSIEVWISAACKSLDKAECL
jgi:hypothetical protein